MPRRLGPLRLLWAVALAVATSAPHHSSVQCLWRAGRLRGVALRQKPVLEVKARRRCQSPCTAHLVAHRQRGSVGQRTREQCLWSQSRPCTALAAAARRHLDQGRHCLWRIVLAGRRLARAASRPAASMRRRARRGGREGRLLIRLARAHKACQGCNIRAAAAVCGAVPLAAALAA